MPDAPTPQVSVSAAQSGVERLVSLDVLRVAVIVMVSVHHAAQPYGPTGGDWPVSDGVRSDWFRPFHNLDAAVGHTHSTVGFRSEVKVPN